MKKYKVEDQSRRKFFKTGLALEGGSLNNNL